MVRGVTILLILNVFSQTLSESVFDKFFAPDKKGKNKILMYLEGKLKPERTTNVKVTTDIYGYTPSPDALKIKHLWEGTAFSWGNAAAVTQPTILQPQKESDSDTLFWRGQQPPENSYHSQLVQGDDGQVQIKANSTKTKGFGEWEDIGDNVIKFWECARYKFFKSYDKVKAKICGWFG